MIPYFEIPPLRIFGLEFHAFGALVALGFISGSHIAAYRAKHLGLKESVVFDAALICMVFGIAGAHIFHVLAYEPHTLLKSPWVLLKFWSGLSSYGGMIGSCLALWIYFKRKNLPLLPYADAISLGVVGGQMIGRLGCFVAHDHPGVLSDFFLAVKFPGGARHDLGFYEAIFLGFLLLLMWALTRSGKKVWGYKGKLMYLLFFCYGAIRFFLEFLRATDVAHADARYIGLTPAQYASMFIFLLGAYGLFIYLPVQKSKK